ncbi:MAG: family 10 glycosylhydrolase [Candidatus Omnitrophica bacterium]|nr:family 10 glycosylhydrolase [Candidatus Omnitrophota bacterium]
MKSKFLKIFIFLIFLNVRKGQTYSEVDLELFKYKNFSEVRKNWLSQEKSKEIELEKEKGKDLIKFPLNFMEVEDRCYWDKFVSLDLSNFEKFIIEVKSENPSLTTNCTIYFESIGGWYRYSFSIDKDNWKKIIIPKSKFKIEGNPSGWNNIKRIRISFWKTNHGQTNVYLRSLKGIISDSQIGIVFCDTAIKKGLYRPNDINRYFSDMADIFEKIGIEYRTLNQSEIDNKLKILIFPYNPVITDQEIEKIKRFVEKDGKIIIFYSPNPEIYKILGIENTIYKKESYIGEFDSVKFDRKVVEGLPEKIKQSSWNAIIPEKINENSKIVGFWIDSEGKSTGLPSAIISDNGFYFSHVLLNKYEGQQMIVSLILHFLPEKKEEIISSIIKNAGKLSGFENFEETKKFIEKKLRELPIRKANGIKSFLNLAMKNYREIKDNYKKYSMEDLFSIKQELEKNLKKAYFSSFKGKENEFRAVWCHSPFGIGGVFWEESIKKLKENNFNAIFPNMLRGGIAYYNSEILPIAQEVKIKGDQIEQCLSACKKYGIECHIWKVNWNLFNAPIDFIEKLREEKRLQVSKEGKEILWLCPSNQINFQLEFESMIEIVKKYNIDGIHFDYIRYPDSNFCYCENCKKRFEQEYNVKIEKWPEDVIIGDYKELYKIWRQELITKLVREVSKEAKRIKPNIKISAAVFPEYPNCKENLGQDWKLWIENGYIDFVCPMNYTDSNSKFKNYLINQNEIIKKKIPFYPGIGAYILSPEDIVRQIEILRQIGIEGFILFDYNFQLFRNLDYFGIGITGKD